MQVRLDCLDVILLAPLFESKNIFLHLATTASRQLYLSHRSAYRVYSPRLFQLMACGVADMNGVTLDKPQHISYASFLNQGGRIMSHLLSRESAAGSWLSRTRSSHQSH